jgi:hypothetical protein
MSSISEELRSERRRTRTLARSARRHGIDVESFEPEGNFFFKLLEPLERPQMAVFNIIDRLQTDPDPEPEELLASAWKGLTGEEKTYFSDILKNAGAQDGMATVVFGLAGDIVLDPINVVPFGLYSKFKKAGAIKLLSSEKGRSLALWADAALRTKSLDSPRKAIQRMFMKRADISPEQARLWEAAAVKEWKEFEKQGRIYVRGEGAAAKVAPTSPEFLEEATRRGIGPEELQKMVRPRVTDFEDTKEGVEAFEKARKYSQRKFSETMRFEADVARDVEERIHWLDRVQNAPLREGKLPHHVLGELIWKSAKNTKEAGAIMQSGFNRELRAFYLQDLRHLSEGDSFRVSRYAEALGFGARTPKGRAYRDEYMARALAGADDRESVIKAGEKMRRMEDWRFDVEDKLGIRRRTLGVFHKQKLQYLGRASEMLRRIESRTQAQYAKSSKLINTEMRRLGEELGRFDFAHAGLNTERDGLVDLINTTTSAQGGMTAADVRNVSQYLDGMMDNIYGINPLKRGQRGEQAREYYLVKKSRKTPKVGTSEADEFGDIGGELRQVGESVEDLGYETVEVTRRTKGYSGSAGTSFGGVRGMGKGAAEKSIRSRVSLTDVGYQLDRRLSAHQKFLEETLPGQIARKKTRLRNVMREKMREFAELQDKVPGYVLHYVNTEVAEKLALSSSKKIHQGMMSEKHASMMHRVWVDSDGAPLPFEEVEKILQMQEKELAAYGASMLKTKKSLWEFLLRRPDRMANYYEMDPASLMFLRSQRTVRAASGVRFHDEMRKIFGGYNLPGGRELPAFGKRGILQTAANGIETLVEGTARFAPDVAEALDGISPAYTSPDAAKTFMNIFDDMQNVWKATTLFPWPAYHTRNFIGNLWNMALGGFFNVEGGGPFWEKMLDPEAIRDWLLALKIQRHLTSGNAQALKSFSHNFKGVNMTLDEIVDLARRKGVIDHGMNTDNYRKAIMHEIKASGGAFKDGRWSVSEMREAMRGANPANILNWVVPSRVTKNPVIRVGHETARGIENQARLAFFINRMRKGDDASTAAAKTATFLFDYADLTNFESQVMRRLAPFYSWTRFNVPIQLQGMLDRPQQFAAIPKVTRAIASPGSPAQPVLKFISGGIEGEGLTPDEYPEKMEIPQWMHRMAGVPLRRNERGEIEFAILGGWLPAADLDRIAPSMLGKTALDMLSPALKIGPELALERSFFYDQSLRGESEMWGVRMSAKLAHTLSTFRLITEFDRLNVLDGVGFSSRRLRPETEDTLGQRGWRFLSGMKVYPVDTRRARIRNLQEVNRYLSIEVGKERRATTQQGMRQLQKEHEEIGGRR